MRFHAGWILGLAAVAVAVALLFSLGVFDLDGESPPAPAPAAVEEPVPPEAGEEDASDEPPLETPTDGGDAIPHAPAPVEGAVVEGRVLDAGGAGVAGAHVYAVAPDASLDAWLGALVREQAPSGVSGNEGAFRVEGLAPGDYRLLVEADGRAPVRSRPFRVSGKETVELDVTLARGPVVRGIVLDRRGEPVAGATVAPAPAGPMAMVPNLPAGPGATTREDGTFSYEGLAKNTDLRATKEGYASATVAGVEPGQKGVRFVLPDLGSIAGVVLTEKGEPVGRFEIETRVAGGGFMGMAGMLPVGDVETPGEGRFLVTGLEAGKYRVAVFAEDLAPGRTGEIEVREGERTDGVEIRLDAGHPLAGVVVTAADGRPVEGATVSANLTGNELLARTGQGRTRTATTGEDGRFVLTGLEEGPAFLRVTHPDYSLAILEAVKVPAPEELRIELGAGGTLLVSLVRADGSPDAGKMIIVQRNMPFQQFQAMVGPDGRTTFEHVPAGGWMVMRMDQEGMQKRGFAGAGLEVRTAEVKNGETTTVEIRDAGGATIRGRVTRGGEPISGAMVFLMKPGSNGQDLAGMKFGSTDPEGAYEVDGVADGEYTISVSQPGAFVPLFSETITVAGADLQRELKLPPGGAGGRVVDDAGKGLADVQLIAVPAGLADFRAGRLDESMRSFGGMTTSAADGRFHFDGLSPGRYVIRAFLEGRSSVYSDPFDMPSLGDGPSDLRIALPAGESVKVEVRGPDGAPVAGAWLFVTDLEGRLLPLGIMQGEKTDTSGAATLHLAEGRYRLEAQPPGLPSVRVPLDVRPGAGTVRVDVPAAGRIAVFVRDPAGNPVANARVDLLDSRGSPASRRVTSDFLTDAGDPTRTDGAGRILLPLVAPGDWTVTVRTDEGATGHAAASVLAGRQANLEIVVE